MITAEEAQSIAAETLRIVACRQDHFAENMREYIGRELDLTDGALLDAVDVLFCGQRTMGV